MSELTRQKFIEFWSSGLKSKVIISCGAVGISLTICCCSLLALTTILPSSQINPTSEVLISSPEVVVTPSLAVTEDSPSDIRPTSTNTRFSVSTITITASPISTNTMAPSPVPTITATLNPIQDIQERFQNPSLQLYDEYSSIGVALENEVLKISVVRQEGDLWGFESLQDISAFLHLALVDCTQYRFGHGIGGCTIKATAPYKYVELREYMPSGELKAYLRFTEGDKKYFFGYDGTEIPESMLFELADESFLQP